MKRGLNAFNSLRRETFEMYERAIDQIDIVGGLALWEPTFGLLTPISNEPPRLTLNIKVPDRNGGADGAFEVSRICFAEDLEWVFSPEGALAHCHRLLKDAVAHEFDEGWLVQGVRVRDPHAGEEA